MASSSAAAYLEALQESTYAATGAKPFDIKEAEEMAANTGFWEKAAAAFGVTPEALAEMQRERYAEAKKLCPTRFEDPGLYSLLIDMAKSLEDTAHEVGWELLPERPVFGTLPLGQVNAMAIRVPDSDEHLIVFQVGLFGFINLFAKALAAAFPVKNDAGGGYHLSTDIDDVGSWLERDDTPISRLMDLLGAYVMVGDPHAARQYFVSGATESLSSLLRETAETFILGHEYGHIRAGHLDTHDEVETKLGSESVEVLPRAWKQEAEADLLGMYLTVQTMANKGFDLAMSFAGIDLVFSGFELVGRALNLLVHGRDETMLPSDTHPPPEVRRELLRQQLAQITDDADQVHGALSLTAVLDAVVAVMWDRIAGVFYDLHSRGAPPASIWAASSAA